MGSATIYKVVKNAYDAGRYSLDDMRLLTFTGTITAEQYKDITGIDYIKDEAGELEHAKKTIDPQQAILNSLASTIIKQQLNTEDKEDK